MVAGNKVDILRALRFERLKDFGKLFGGNGFALAGARYLEVLAKDAAQIAPAEKYRSAFSVRLQGGLFERVQIRFCYGQSLYAAPTDALRSVRPALYGAEIALFHKPIISRERAKSNPISVDFFAFVFYN